MTKKGSVGKITATIRWIGHIKGYDCVGLMTGCAADGLLLIFLWSVEPGGDYPVPLALGNKGFTLLSACCSVTGPAMPVLIFALPSGCGCW
jgi:hypothetical protein